MAFLNIARLADTAYKMVHVGNETEVRSSYEDGYSERYTEVLRLVVQFDIKTVQNIDFVGGLSVFSSVDNVYVQGAGPLSFKPPSGFGEWHLLRQHIDTVEVDGSEMCRVTEEYVCRAVTGTDITWTTFDWS